MLGEPRKQSWTKVKTDKRVVIDVGSVALSMNALIPIMKRRSARLGFDFPCPWVLARWLIKVAVNYESGHAKLVCASLAAPSNPALSPHSARAIFPCCAVVGKARSSTCRYI